MISTPISKAFRYVLTYVHILRMLALFVLMKPDGDGKGGYKKG